MGHQPQFELDIYHTTSLRYRDIQHKPACMKIYTYERERAQINKWFFLQEIRMIWTIDYFMVYDRY